MALCLKLKVKLAAYLGQVSVGPRFISIRPGERADSYSVVILEYNHLSAFMHLQITPPGTPCPFVAEFVQFKQNYVLSWSWSLIPSIQVLGSLRTLQDITQTLSVEK